MGSLLSLADEREASARHSSSIRLPVGQSIITSISTKIIKSVGPKNRRRSHFQFKDRVDQSWSRHIKGFSSTTDDSNCSCSFLMSVASKMMPDNIVADVRIKKAFVDILASKMTMLEIPENIKIYAEGDTGTSLYVVESGTLEMRSSASAAATDDSASHPVRMTVQSGEVFGEQAFLFDSPRSATVVSTSCCRLWRLDRDLYRQFKSASCSFSLPISAQRFLELPEIASFEKEMVERLFRLTTSGVYARHELLSEAGRATTKLMVIEEGVVDLLIPEHLYGLSRKEQLAALGISIDPTAVPLVSNPVLRLALSEDEKLLQDYDDDVDEDDDEDEEEENENEDDVDDANHSHVASAIRDESVADTGAPRNSFIDGGDSGSLGDLTRSLPLPSASATASRTELEATDDEEDAPSSPVVDFPPSLAPSASFHSKQSPLPELRMQHSESRSMPTSRRTSIHHEKNVPVTNVFPAHPRGARVFRSMSTSVAEKSIFERPVVELAAAAAAAESGVGGRRRSISEKLPSPIVPMVPSEVPERRRSISEKTSRRHTTAVVIPPHDLEARESPVLLPSLSRKPSRLAPLSEATAEGPRAAGRHSPSPIAAEMAEQEGSATSTAVDFTLYRQSSSSTTFASSTGKPFRINDPVHLKSSTKFEEMWLKLENMSKLTAIETPAVVRSPLPVLPTLPFTAPHLLPTPSKRGLRVVDNKTPAPAKRSLQEVKRKKDEGGRRASTSKPMVPPLITQVMLHPQLSKKRMLAANPYTVGVVESRRHGERFLKVGKGAIIGTGVLASLMGVPGSAEWVDRVESGVPCIGAVSPVTVTAASETVVVRCLHTPYLEKILARNGPYYSSMALFRSKEVQEYFTQFKDMKAERTGRLDRSGSRRSSTMVLEAADDDMAAFEDTDFQVEQVISRGEEGALLVEAAFDPTAKSKIESPAELQRDVVSRLSSTMTTSSSSSLTSSGSRTPQEHSVGQPNKGHIRWGVVKTALTLKRRLLDVRQKRASATHLVPRPYTLKVVSKAQAAADSMVQRLLIEANLLRSKALQHPFIVRFHGKYQTDNAVVFVMQRYPATDLWNLVHVRASNSPSSSKPAPDPAVPRRGPDQSLLSLDLVRFYLASVILALSHMHEYGVAFRNLAPENVLIDENGFVKLVGFANAKKFPFTNDGFYLSNRSYTVCGTVEYMAPEMVTISGHTLPVDAWALGVLAHELLNGETPFEVPYPSPALSPSHSPSHRPGLAQGTGIPVDAIQSEPLVMTAIARSAVAGVTLSREVQVNAYKIDGALALLTGLLDPQPTSRWTISSAPTAQLTQNLFFAEFEWDKLRNQSMAPPYVPPPPPPSQSLLSLKEIDEPPAQQIDPPGPALGSSAHMLSKRSQRKLTSEASLRFPFGGSNSSPISAATSTSATAASANAAADCTQLSHHYRQTSANGRPSGLVHESDETVSSEAVGALFAAF